MEETLLFSALIRAYLSDRPFEPNAMKQEAYELINKFSLDSVSGTIIGDQSLRGVSGGERKRVAIASEILGNPSLLGQLISHNILFWLRCVYFLYFFSC